MLRLEILTDNNDEVDRAQAAVKRMRLWAPVGDASECMTEVGV